MLKLADITTRYSGTLTTEELRQLDQKELALGLWRQGQPENALLILVAVLSQLMTDRIAAEIWTAQSGIEIELGQFEESQRSLDVAGRFIDEADAFVHGLFYYNRARVHKEFNRIDAAITDYSGAVIFLHEAGLKDREATAYNSLACLYLKIGDKQRARECIDQALAIDLNGSTYECQILDTLAEIQLAEGQLDAANKTIREALDRVGENDLWRKGFSLTQDKIETELLRVLGVRVVQDLDSVRARMTRRALQKTSGNLSQAGKLLGVDHRGVNSIISQHPELEQYRKERQTRLKSIMKKV